MLNSIYQLVVALAIAIVGLSFTANGADIQTGGQDPGRQSRRGVPGDLGLTDEQKASLGAIRQTEREQIEAIRNNASLSQEEKRDQIRQIQQSSRQQSMALLTPEQQQAIAARRSEGRGRPGDIGPRDIGPRDIGLTDEQKQSLQTIRQSEREQIQAVRNNETLTNEERRNRIDAIRQNTRQQTQSILTPEQQQAIRTRRNQGSNGQPGIGNRQGGGFGGRMGGNRPGGGRRGGRP